MELIQDTLVQNREEAGLALSQKLRAYANSDAIVVGVPYGGVCVADVIARHLLLQLEVIPCRRIKHPANDNKNIGSVSLNEVYLHENTDNIPQDFIAHQIAMLKSANSFEQRFYHDGKKPLSLTFKTVILVDDLLKSSESFLACIREIKKQKPLKIIVAVPLVSAEAARIIGAEVDDIFFLKMEPEIRSPKDYYKNFESINKERVKMLLDISNRNRLFHKLISTPLTYQS